MADPVLVPIDRTKQPFRIYKPLFLDANHIIRDLDREFESISQALIWATDEINKLKKEVVDLTARVTALEGTP